MKTNIHLLLYLAHFFLEWEKFQAEIVEKIRTHILYSVTLFFFFENRPVYEIMWKNIVQPERPQMTVWHMRISYWVPKATDTQTQNICLSAATVVARKRLNVTLTLKTPS